MKKPYLMAGIALLLALGAFIGLTLTVTAEELSPPYVILLKPWSFNATEVAVVPAVGERPGYAYVLAQRGVAVFSGLEFTATVEVLAPAHLATDWVQGYVYVTSNSSTEVTILHGKRITTTIDVGSTSSAVAAMPNGPAYVILPDDDPDSNDRIAIIQVGVPTPTLVTVGKTPVAIGVNPVTGYVYVVNQDSNSVTVLQGMMVVATLSVGSQPTAIGVNVNTGNVYVSNTGGGAISVIRGVEVTSNILGIKEPGEIAINAKTNRAYVLSNDTSDIAHRKSWVVVIDDKTIVTTIDMPHDTLAIDVNPNSGYVYVNNGTNYDNSFVTILSDTMLLESFPMGQTANDVAVDPVADLAYVPIYNGQVAIFGRTRIFASEPLDPGSPATTLSCYNTQQGQNLPITITIPTGALPSTLTLPTGSTPPTVTIQTTNTRVLCTPLMIVDAEPDYVWARQGFRLSVSHEGVTPLNFAFNQPLTVTMAYVRQLPTLIEETELVVRRRRLSGAQWFWLDSGIQKINQTPATQLYTVNLLPVGEYALLWFKPHIYMPLIVRQY